MTTKRWPMKPAQGQKCDASTGWKSGALGEPLITRCTESAVETVLMDNGMTTQIYLCQKHAETTKGILRNPRRKRDA